MKITIIGMGTMGSAITRSLRASRSKNMSIAIIDRATKHFSAVASADVVIVAVKPQDLAALAQQVKHVFPAKAILVSIAAGVPIAKLVAMFEHKKVVRMMPNLGLSVGQGIAVWKRSTSVNAGDRRAIQRIFAAISENFELSDEALIDAVTAISGSGPAYFFYWADALLEAAQEFGIPKKMSVALVKKTLSASASLQDHDSYSALIKKIASKKGTTEAALAVFEKNTIKDAIKKGARAAQKRAAALSHE